MNVPKQVNHVSRRLLRAIGDFVDAQGYPPTMRDLQRLASFKSTSVVREHLIALEREGFVMRDAHVTRSVRLSQSGADIARDGPAEAPC